MTEAPNRAAAVWLPLLYAGPLAAFTLLIILYPTIDLEVSRTIQDWLGNEFLSVDGLLAAVYFGLRPLVYAVAAAVALVGLFNLLVGRRFLGLTRRAAAFILLTFALGPGLAVDWGLKDHWGRARPRDIVEFGGERRFTPALEPSDQCERNCAFVSGHAALAFSFVAFALLAARRWRAPAVAITIVLGGLVGLMRIAQGAHFLSDVVYAGFLVLGIAWILRAVIMDTASAPRRLIGRRGLGP
jgi:lipid A 4'-phosphatase